MNLVNGDPLVGQMQNLVIQIGIGVPLRPHDLLNPVIAPPWPAVGGKHDLCVLAEMVQGFIDTLGPLQGIPYQGPPQRINVVDGACDVFRRPKGLKIWEIRIHFRRGFCVWRVLEDHSHPIQRHFLERFFHNSCGGNQARGAYGYVFPNGLIHVTVGATWQQHTILINQPPCHGVASINVFRNRVIHESNRGNDGNFATFNIRFIHHAPNAAKVIGVGMGINHGHNRTFAQFFIDKIQGGSGCFPRG